MECFEVAVCAAHILTKMVAQAAITITFEQIRSILEAAGKWCSESNPRETVRPRYLGVIVALFFFIRRHRFRCHRFHHRRFRHRCRFRCRREIMLL